MYNGKKQTLASTSELGLTMRLSYNLLPDVHGDAVNDELLEALRQCLQEVSRQRLRSILISFRRQANQENCLALKDLISILNENKVKLRSRTTKLLQTKFNKKHGLDYEALWKIMVEAQSRTGRDSVLAIHGNRDAQGTSGSHLSSAISDAQDKELLTKLHKVLQTSDGFDLQEMRTKCKSIDVTQHGLIPKKKLRMICSEYHVPVVGPLLSTLMTRCDDEKNGNISWPEFMSLLEKAVNFKNSAPPPGRPKSVASSQKFISLSGSVNDNNCVIKDKTSKPEPVKKEKSPLRKQKSVTFDSKSNLPSVDSGVSLAVGQSFETMGDEDMENDFLRSEQRRISGPSSDSMPSATTRLRQEASLSISEVTKLKASKESMQEKKPKVDLSTHSLPSPLTQSSGTTKKQTRPSTGRVQSAKPKPTNNRPTSRAASRSAKKVKVPEGVAKASPRGSSGTSAKSKEKIAMVEKVYSPEPGKENKTIKKEEECKDETVSLNQSNNYTTSAVTTITTAGNSDSTKDLDPQDVTSEDQDRSTENPEGDVITQGDPEQTVEQTSSNSTLQKSASSPSIASTQISHVSQDSQDSHSSSQASDQPLITASKKPAADSRSVRSFASSMGEDKKRSMGSTLMQSFKSLIKRGKKEEEGEDGEEEDEEMDEEEEELLMLGGGDEEEDYDEEKFDDMEYETEDLGAEDQNELEKEPEEAADKESMVANNLKPQVNKLEVIVQGKEVTYYIPDKYSKTHCVPDPPNADLQLDWVYGYRGNDCRGNLFEVSDGAEILYFMSNIGIVYNPTLNTQRHYTKHTAEIRSMHVHSDNITVATGQAKGIAGSEVKPMVHLWKVDTLDTLLVFDDDFENAIICLAFSPLQDYLLAVDQSSKNTLSIWNYKTGKKVTSSSLNTTVVCQASFHPKDPNKIVSIGREHLVFWELKNGVEDGVEMNIEQTMAANFENNMKAKYVISMSFRANGDLVTGDSNGTIYVWPSGGNTISHTISHAHEGPVFTLQMIGKTVVSGGRDGFMRCWTLAGKGADSNGKLQIPKQEGGIRTVLHTGSKVYIGTTINSLLRVDLKDNTFSVTGEETTNCVTQAHYEEVHCMAILADDQFLTGSYDGTVSLCNFADHRPLWRYMVKGTNIHCMDVHLDTGLVALGTKDANVVVLMLGQTSEDTEVNRFKLGKGAACCLKISPDGELIAVGCQDNQILLLKAHNKGSTLEMIGKFTGHSGPITGLDWSKDKIGEAEPSYLVQSSSDQMEYVIWNSKTFEATENLEEVWNVEWSSQQCLMGYPVAGIFGKEEEGLQHASVDISQTDYPLVVAGGYDGQIRLFIYPCTHSETQYKQFAAHPHCAVCVRFASSSEQYLLSVGSKDYTVCQWKISSAK